MIASLNRLICGLLFMIAGTLHFTSPHSYVKIMPAYLPWPLALVYCSGAAEMGLGALLWFPRTARLAGWGLIALLVAVFPANLNMALHPGISPSIAPALLWIRLPVQALLIKWVHGFTQNRIGDLPSPAE